MEQGTHGDPRRYNLVASAMVWRLGLWLDGMGVHRLSQPV